MTMTEYDPDPGTDISTACDKACEMVRTTGGVVKLTFNGTDVIAMSGMTPNDVYATWYAKRKAEQQARAEPIIAELRQAAGALSRSYPHTLELIRREIGSLSE